MVEDPTYDRTILISLRTFGADRRGRAADRRRASTSTRSSGRCDAGPVPDLRLHDPELPEPGRRHAARGRPPAAGRAGPRARLAGARGRPVRPAALRGRAAADAARAGRRRQRHLLDVVHEDRGARGSAPATWCCPERLVGPLKAISENTIIGPNTLAEATLAAYCRAGRFEPNVERATAMLKARRDAMEEALRQHFPAGATWTTPTGGYFYWVDLPEALDTGDAARGGGRTRRPLRQGRRLLVLRRRPVVAAAGLQRRASRSSIGEGVARLGELLAESLEPAAV